ncbi:MAG: MFS transporter [Streptosporangiaceae bacterium]
MHTLSPDPLSPDQGVAEPEQPPTRRRLLRLRLPRPRWGVLGQPDFRNLWIGETASALGTAVGSVALALVAVVTLKASPITLGVLTAAAWVPWLFIGLVAGAWVDRWPRRTVMLVCDLALLALFASVPAAAWLGVLTIGQLVTVALLAGSVKVFFSTAYRSLLPSLVAKPELLEANVKLGAGESAADIAGPGLAGVVAQTVGAVTGLLGDAVSYLVSALCLLRIKAPQTPAEAAPRTGLRREIAEGVRFLTGDPLLRTLACFGAVGNLALGGIQAVQTLFLIRAVGLSPGAVGTVFAFVSIGGFVGATIAGRLARRFGSARVCGVVAGNVIAGSFYQIYSPPEMLGRIRASSSTVNFGAFPLGALLGGYLGQALGSRATVWIMATVLLSGGVILLVSPLRGLRDFPGQRPA